MVDFKPPMQNKICFSDQKKHKTKTTHANKHKHTKQSPKKHKTHTKRKTLGTPYSQMVVGKPFWPILLNRNSLRKKSKYE